MAKNNTRIAAKGLIFLKGKYLLMLRSGKERIMPSLWDIPGGGAEKGETVLETLIREVKEETGIDISSAKIMPLKKWAIRKGKNKISGTDFLCFVKKSKKIKLSPEHTRAKWFTEREIIDSKEVPEWLKETVALSIKKSEIKMTKKIIGLPRKKVKLFSYNPLWNKLYKKEERLFRSVIGKYILDIQHVGSTSVPGAKAKPIIDMAAAIPKINKKEIKKFIEPLKKVGYEYGGEDRPRQHLFIKGNEKNRTCYLHVVKFDSKVWRNYLLFRNYLRKHKKAVKEYNQLKEKLAKKYKDDRDAYTAQKRSFIQKIIKKAKKLGPQAGSE